MCVTFLLPPGIKGLKYRYSEREDIIGVEIAEIRNQKSHQKSQKKGLNECGKAYGISCMIEVTVAQKSLLLLLAVFSVMVVTDP